MDSVKDSLDNFKDKLMEAANAQQPEEKTANQLEA
jgi:hypothetical protein